MNAPPPTLTGRHGAAPAAPAATSRSPLPSRASRPLRALVLIDGLGMFHWQDAVTGTPTDASLEYAVVGAARALLRESCAALVANKVCVAYRIAHEGTSAMSAMLAAADAREYFVHRGWQALRTHRIEIRRHLDAGHQDASGGSRGEYVYVDVRRSERRGSTSMTTSEGSTAGGARATRTCRYRVHAAHGSRVDVL